MCTTQTSRTEMHFNEKQITELNNSGTDILLYNQENRPKYTTIFGTQKITKIPKQKPKPSELESSGGFVPWRSPHLKRKNFSNTQSPSIDNLEATLAYDRKREKSSNSSSLSLDNLTSSTVNRSSNENLLKSFDSLTDTVEEQKYRSYIKEEKYKKEENYLSNLYQTQIESVKNLSNFSDKKFEENKTLLEKKLLEERSFQEINEKLMQNNINSNIQEKSSAFSNNKINLTSSYQKEYAKSLEETKNVEQISENFSTQSAYCIIGKTELDYQSPDLLTKKNSNRKKPVAELRKKFSSADSPLPPPPRQFSENFMANQETFPSPPKNHSFDKDFMKNEEYENQEHGTYDPYVRTSAVNNTEFIDYENIIEMNYQDQQETYRNATGATDFKISPRNVENKMYGQEPINNEIKNGTETINYENEKMINSVNYCDQFNQFEIERNENSESKITYEDNETQEYQHEPIINRIQHFEKQASLEPENKPKEAAHVKPVGPWVKKSSTGVINDNLIYQSPISSPQNLVANYCSEVTINDQEKVETKCSAAASLHVGQRNTERRPSQGDYSYSYMQDTNEPIDKFESNNSSEYKTTQNKNAQTNGTHVKKSADENYTNEIKDPYCDPENPKEIQFQDISAAAFKIKSGIMNTPCTRSNISSLLGIDVYFKKEFNQFTGSFKERGARYVLLCLSEEQREKGVIAASAGNHALALSYHGQDLGIPVTVVMPVIAPIMKIQACRQYGANILVKGNDMGECKELALTMAQKDGLFYVNGYDHPQILAGQGTIGLEIVEQVKDIDAVIVPVGGGGLIAGISLAVKSLFPKIQIIGVEAEKCPSFSAALREKKPVYVKSEPSLADGLAVPKVGVNAFKTASKFIDKMITVSEEFIAIAILRLVEREKAVVEGAGAIGLAALLAGLLPELKGKRVIIPLCGGNIDTTVLGRCLERGLTADHRLVQFTVTVSDRPGGIAELTRLMANLGVSIKDMLHERAWIRNDIYSTEVKVVCETRDYEHLLELKSAIENRYPLTRFRLT